MYAMFEEIYIQITLQIEQLVFFKEFKISENLSFYTSTDESGMQ